MLLLKRNNVQPVTRDFSPSYLLDHAAQRHYEEFGYAVIKNVIRDEELDEALKKFHELQKMEGYDVQVKFESSGNFRSLELQKHVFSYIFDFMSTISPRIANMDHCEIGSGGAFFIKPNTEESKLEPHQDSPVIDETQTYAIFTWMPLHDINKENGPLYVLPKSHLWGNAYRSQHVPWAFRKMCPELWKHMIPIYVDRGDILFFDPSIIHGSGVNRSDDFRVVLCGALLPRGHQKIEYTLSKKTINQYLIDDSYWLDGGQPSALVNYKYNTLEYGFPNPVKKRDINALVNSSTT